MRYCKPCEKFVENVGEHVRKAHGRNWSVIDWSRGYTESTWKHIYSEPVVHPYHSEPKTTESYMIEHGRVIRKEVVVIE